MQREEAAQHPKTQALQRLSTTRRPQEPKNFGLAVALAAGLAVAATALGGAPPQVSIAERVAELERRVEVLGEHAALAEDLLRLRATAVGLASCRTRNLATIVESQHLHLREYPEWQELLGGWSSDCDAAKAASQSLLEATQ